MVIHILFFNSSRSNAVRKFCLSIVLRLKAMVLYLFSSLRRDKGEWGFFVALHLVFALLLIFCCT